MNSDVPSSNSSRPPIPARLHDKPTAQGLTIPYLTLCHRGRLAPVWGAIDPHRYALVLTLRLCQVCGENLGDGEGPGNRVIVFVRPQDWLRGVGPEPGVHPECAAYSIRACPMLVPRQFTNSEVAILVNRRASRSSTGHSASGFDNRRTEHASDRGSDHAKDLAA
ncbi:hypothetical protein [Nocardia sp. NPDC056100]|uniref:hypothetical protein n=1 Tax=Nocardia sp. NPDC056100 TaxID=3345712 RepID=UPI0035E18C26